MLCLLAHSRPLSKPEGWWIERETPGWSLTLTERGRRRGNAPYLKGKTCPRPFAAWIRSVLQGTKDANAGRLSGRAQPSLRRTAESRLGSCGKRGNGRYRTELRQGCASIKRYLTAHQISQARVLLRLDGQYGTG